MAEEIDAHAMEMAEEISPLVDEIGCLLHGKDLLVQGAVLAEVVAMWVLNHPPGARSGMLKIHAQTVKEMIKQHDAWTKGMVDEICGKDE